MDKQKHGIQLPFEVFIKPTRIKKGESKSEQTVVVVVADYFHDT